jgi:protein SCO1
VSRWWAAFALAVAVAARAGSAVPDVGWTQRVGAPLPLQLKFLDESGQRVTLRHYFHDMPVVIVFAYLSCSRLCPEVLTGVDEVLHDTGLSAGRDYELLVLSIDPNDSHRSFRRDVRLLTSPDGAVSQVAAAAGFRYVRADRQRQYGHAAGFLIATPQGTISRYFLGVRYPADEVKAALLAARNDRIGNLAARLLLLCYGSDPAHGSRSASIMTALQALAVLGLLFVAALGWRSLVRRGRPQ